MYQIPGKMVSTEGKVRGSNLPLVGTSEDGLEEARAILGEVQTWNMYQTPGKKVTPNTV